MYSDEWSWFLQPMLRNYSKLQTARTWKRTFWDSYLQIKSFHLLQLQKTAYRGAFNKWTGSKHHYNMVQTINLMKQCGRRASGVNALEGLLLGDSDGTDNKKHS